MTWPAAIAVGLALLLYLRFPVDLLPDRLGAIGFLDDLIVLVGGLWWLRRRMTSSKPATAPAEAVRDTPWDPYAVLGLPPGASTEEITKAYREQMRRHHPDHVAHLGEDIRELAHRKALDIQRAYDEIGRS